MDKEKSFEDYKDLQKTAELNSYKQYTVILGLILIIIIGVFIFNHQWLKTQKDKELLASELRRIEEEHKNAEDALSGYTENLKQKNEIIEEFKTELEKLQSNVIDRDFAANIEKLMQAHIMTDDSWEDFKKLFIKVHPDFYTTYGIITRDYLIQIYGCLP